jgi:hypothetical protein
MAIIWVGTGRFNAYIGPVQDYIDRVVAADVAAGNTLGLEVGVRDAYDVFIRDSINVGDLGTSGGVLSQANSIIKAAPIMAGARTLAGALVPLVGPAPTNFNFVAGDYNRKTGLSGNGTTKYLDSNRNNNADPQNSKHVAVRVSTIGAGSIFNSGPAGTAGRTGLATDGFASCNNDVGTFNSVPLPVVGLLGVSRSSSINYTYRANLSNTTVSASSGAPNNSNILFYARPGTPPDSYATSRLAFYSIGESLDLALLDARVTILINAIAAAIP